MPLVLSCSELNVWHNIVMFFNKIHRKDAKYDVCYICMYCVSYIALITINH